MICDIELTLQYSGDETYPSPLAQPFTLSALRMDPALSWPIKWLRHLIRRVAE